MFRKPIKTYERKKGGLHYTTSTIIREDVPPDRDAETLESLASGDSNDTISDPFDTTFDRIAKTAKMPPKPPSDDSGSSYGDSSSSSNSDVTSVYSDVPPIPLPLIDPQPLVKRQRVFRRQKAEKDNPTMETKRLKKLPKRLGRLNRSNILNDENTQPNVENAADGNKRGKENDAKSHEKMVKKQRVLKKRTPLKAYRGRIQRSLDNSKSRQSEESTKVSNIENVISDNETKENDETSIAGFSKTDENRLTIKKNPITKVSDATLKIIVDRIPTPTFEKQSEIFKNPTVSLTRLNITQRYSVGNISLMSSTPLIARAAKKKSVLHISPINRNASMMIGVQHEDENSGETILPPKSSDRVVESPLVKHSRQLSEITEEKVKKRRAFVLSDSPAADPSRLMFDDTEAPEEHSSSVAAPEEVFFAAGPSYRKDECKNATEALPTSLLKGFSIESSDPESLHLLYDAADKTASSPENIAQSFEKTASHAVEVVSLEVNENYTDGTEVSTTTEIKELTNDSSDAESLHSKINDEEDIHSNEENDNESSSGHIANSADSTHSERRTPSEKSLDISSESTSQIADTSETFDSDDEWTTIPGSPDTDANLSTEKNVSSKDSSKRSKHYKRNSIEQLSSNDENISSDDIVELVNANNENALIDSLYMNTEIAEVENANGNKEKIVESSDLEVTNKRNFPKSIRLKLMKPVVLVERLVLPVGKAKGIAEEKKESVEKSSKSIETIQKSAFSSNDGNVSDIETPVFGRKSRKITKVKKSNGKNRFTTIEPSISISDDDSVVDNEIPIPARKSRRNTITEKTKLTNRSDKVESIHLSLSSDNDSVFDNETPISARKSRRNTITEKTALIKPSDTMISNKNSTLSSANSSVSGSESPVAVRKLKKNTITGKTALIKNSEVMDSSKNSTLSSANSSVSGSESPVPTRKSKKNVTTEKTALIKPFEVMDSTQNSTLDSDDSVFDTKSPVPTRKFKKNTIKKKAKLVNLSRAAEFSETTTRANKKSIQTKEFIAPDSSQNSTVNSADDSVSGTESPVPQRKSRKNPITKKTEFVNRSDAMKSNKNSTQNSADDSVSGTESPVPQRKSRKNTITKKTELVNRSDAMKSNKNSTQNSADDSVSGTESPVPQRKSRKNSITKKTEVVIRSEAMKSNKNSTQNSADDSVSGTESLVPEKKSKKNTSKKVESVNNSETADLSQNSTLSSVDETPAAIKKSQKTTRANKRNRKNRSFPSDSSNNSTLSSPDEGVSDNDEVIPVKKSRKTTQAKRQNAKDSVLTDIEAVITTENDESKGDTDGSVDDEAVENAAEPHESLEIDLSERRNSNEDSFPHSITEEINANRSSSAKPEDNQIEELPSEKISIVETLENPRRSSIEPVVLLTRLNDPIRVSSRRRKKLSNLYSQLNVIPENLEGKSSNDIEEIPEENENSESYRFSQTIREPPTKLSGEEEKISQQTTASCGTSIFSNTIDESKYERRESRLLYLKPGKSWARSLSILSTVHSQEDVESLAVGKGKKWRESVNNILQMQQQGLLQSCVKKNEDDKESQSLSGVRNSAATWNSESSQSDTSRMFSGSSPGRFVRRVSIRVVPDGSNVECIEDTPFREAYGITTCENRKTIGKRSTSIVPRKTLVYNVQNVSYDNIPKNINTVKSRDVVLRQCSQENSLPFEECYPLSYLKNCRKIGEGVYGEVFLHQKGTEKTVIKIIPIEGEMCVNNERQKRFDEILSEIVIAKELHNLRFAESSNTSSFVEVKNIRCVAGKYPRKLIELWNTYDEEKNSENDCPAMFADDQLYIVLELSHGGEDLEAFVFQNASESHALFMQTAVALAVAEEKLDFEHRDLHWGNILIARTDETHVEYKLRDKTIRLVSKGVKVSVIDFTLSRMSYQGCSIFNDLSMDEDLFAAQGEYQFEIYRLMRQKVENDWQRFEPFTNVLWLHYTLDKMITAARYRRKGSKIHNNSIEKLCELKDTILNYKSAYDFVTKCDKATRLQGSRTSVNTVS